MHQESVLARAMRRFSVMVLAPLLCLLSIPTAVSTIQKPDLGLRIHNLEVAVVVPGGPADRAGVRVGDHVRALDGHVLAFTTEFYAVQAATYSLQPRILTVERGGVVRDVALVPRRVSQPRLVWGLSMWLAGLAFLMIGWWVLTRRHDAVGRNFFGLCLVFAFFLLDVPDLPNATYMTVKDFVREVMQLLLPLFFLRFFRLFPTTLPGAPAPRKPRILMLPPLVLFLLTVAMYLTHQRETSPAVRVLTGITLLYFVVYFVAGLVAFARKVWRRDRPVLHSKLRVILLGLVCGLVPFLTAHLMAGLPEPPIPHTEYLGFSLLLVPASFALAIMRYGALDTAFVVRIGLVYGLVTLAIVAAYVVAVAGLGHLITQTYGLDELPVMVLAIAGCSLAVLPLRRAIQRWVDSMFYPARRADREALARLARELSDQMDQTAAHELLLARLHALYRPGHVALMLAENDFPAPLRCVHALAGGKVRPVDCALAPDGALPGFLNRIRRPVYREEYEDALPAHSHDDETRTVLDDLGAVLLVPLVTGNALQGMIVLGAKRSGDLYSQTDLTNLGPLALQAAPALRSLRLYRESLRQRQLETELGVAREIQSQLLPTAPLDTARFSIAGHMEPCTEIGGDYFDYFLLDDGTLGLAIADVAGKGIPASLLMTTVRVTFRAEALPGRAPDAVVGALNRSLSQLLASDQFVSFFYGIFDPETRQITYSNAGMDPPLLLRADGSREVLRKGGPVLGVAPDHTYRRGTVRLEPGDLLLAYTDGITEQTAPDGEFFDLPRLEALANQARNLSPRDLCVRIFGAVAAFGGPEASDDETAMVLKFHG